MISTIIFDLNQTLITFTDKDVDADYRKLTGLSEQEFWAKRHPSFSQYCVGEFDASELFGRMLDAHGLSRKLIPQIHDLHARSQTPVEGMQDLVKELHGRFRLVLLAGDGRELYEEKMEILGLKEYFDAIYVTSDLALHKNDPRIYTLVLEREQLRPEECVFIDDLKSFIKAASSVGILALLFVDARTAREQLKKLRVLSFNT